MCTRLYYYYTHCGDYDECGIRYCKWFGNGTCQSGELDKHEVAKEVDGACWLHGGDVHR
tara:strand:+ start:2387 stop:2563 length:177 start_codon:yes stop_codon:yes gene_type:complete